MGEAFSVALSLVIGLIFVASFVQWVRLLWSRRSLLGQGFLDSILPAKSRHRPFWSPADALLMLGIIMLLTHAMARKGWIQTAVGGAGEPEQTASSLIVSIVASSACGVLAVAVAIPWLHLFNRHATDELGLRWSMEDLKLGIRAAVLILPPVMMISAAVSVLIPYEHPVLESLEKIATPTVFAATFIATAIITPVVEEVLIRGLLQGSLQAIADRGPDPGLVEGEWRPRSYWPVVVASFVFACLHMGQGAAPIPLFALACALGFLYRQTGSLIPSIVVHMILNGLTLAVTFLKITSS